MTAAGTPAWTLSAVERHESGLIHYARRILGDEDRARDVVQETFLKLCRERNPESIENHLTPWLYRVCRNAALDIKRREKRMSSVADENLLTTPAKDASAEARVEQQEDLGQVAGFLERLTPKQQEIIQLRFQHELSYKEIASVTGLTVSNVGFQLHCGLKALREHFKAVHA